MSTRPGSLVLFACAAAVTLAGGRAEARGAADIFNVLSDLSSRPRLAKTTSQCPDISNERHLPALGNNAVNWTCYAVLDSGYLLGGVAHGTLTNWITANQVDFDSMANDVAVWTDANKKNILAATTALSPTKRATLIAFLRQLAIAVYVKSSDKMNGFLWSPDRADKANKDANLDTTPYRLALRLWAVQALEDAIAAQPRQAHGVSTFRGKVARSSTLADVQKHFHDGAMVWEPAFISTSKSRPIALGYSQPAQPLNILFEITGSTSGGDLQIGQQEITFPPNTVFRVVGAPQVLNNHAEAYTGNGFVANGCNGACNGTWPALVVITLQEDPAGRNQLTTAEQEVENICGTDHFVKQCGRHELLDAVTGKRATIARKFAGTTIADCDQNGKTYSCSTRTTASRCMACVLCQDTKGKVATKSATLPDPSCTGRDVSADGFYFE